MYLGNRKSGSDGGKNAWILLVVILSGVVLGGFLGELLSMLGSAISWLEFLRWLNYGFDFGFSSPFTLDLGIITITFGFTIKLTLCGIIGLLAGVFIYKRV